MFSSVIRALLCVFLALAGNAGFAQSQDFYTDCDKFPNSLACMAAGDAPAPEQVPSQTRDITPQSGPVFGGGGCPANLNVGIAGRSITVISMATPCAWIVDYMRPLILLLAALSAVFIIFPNED